MKQAKLTIVHEHLRYPKVSLCATSSAKFIHIAAEIDRSSTPFYWRTSSKKKAAIGLSTEALQKLQAQHPALEFSLFKAKLRPPGRGRYIREHYAAHQFAAYDFVIFISIDSENSRQTLMSSPTFQQLVQKLNQLARKTTITQASNIRQIGPVPPLAGHTFLFNYFSAENTAQNLGIWEYTASWFEKETQLKNSVLLLPDSSSSYSIINHCSWPSIWDILPKLLFKSSFRSYVLDNFYANNVGAQPILYRLISTQKH